MPVPGVNRQRIQLEITVGERYHAHFDGCIEDLTAIQGVIRVQDFELIGCSELEYCLALCRGD